MLADVIRFLSALLALVLVPACVYAAVQAPLWDQRVRFVALAVLGALIIGWQLELVGEPPSWRMPFVVSGTALALTGVIMFLVRRHRERQSLPEGRQDGG